MEAQCRALAAPAAVTAPVAAAFVLLLSAASLVAGQATNAPARFTNGRYELRTVVGNMVLRAPILKSVHGVPVDDATGTLQDPVLGDMSPDALMTLTGVPVPASPNAGQGRRRRHLQTGSAATPCAWAGRPAGQLQAWARATNNNSLLSLDWEYGSCGPNLQWVVAQRARGLDTIADGMYQYEKIVADCGRIGNNTNQTCDAMPWCGWQANTRTCIAGSGSGTLFLRLCPKTRVWNYYHCTQAYKNETLCNNDINCEWRPHLRLGDDTRKCFSKWVPRSIRNPQELDQWLIHDFTNVTKEEYWGWHDPCGKWAARLRAFAYRTATHAIAPSSRSETLKKADCSSVQGMWRFSIFTTTVNGTSGDWASCPGQGAGCFACWADQNVFYLHLFGQADSWLKRAYTQCHAWSLNERGHGPCTRWALM